MDRLREMEMLVAVVDAGSFARASANLRVSPPAVTRAVSSLEARLGVRLLNRTTRSLSLTDAGARFLENSRRLLSEIELAEKDATGEAAVPHGHLTVSASVTLGRTAVAPLSTAFLGEHPRVTVTLRLLDRLVNIVEEGIDVAIRIGRLPDSTLIARQVGFVRRILVASPDYLARHGAPTSPTDLRNHDIIGFEGLMPNREWRYVNGNASRQISLSPRIEINDATAAIAAAESGYGITTALSYMVSDAIGNGRLVPVLDEFAPPPVPVQLVYPQSRLVAPKVRAFVDFAAPRLTRILEGLTIGPDDLTPDDT